MRLVAESARLTAMREVSVWDEGPETRFAWVGEDRVAFQVFGDGEIDLLYVSASGDPVDLRWNWPPYADFLRRLDTCARVITFDPRGIGSSDRPSGERLPTWERWVDDARRDPALGRPNLTGRAHNCRSALAITLQSGHSVR